MAAAEATADSFFSFGGLSKTFNKVAWGAVKLATIGVIAAVAWQMFLDPMFFPLFHDTTNVVAQAWVMKINELFSWIPQTVGLAKTPGLLTPVMENFLSNEIAMLTPPDPATLANNFAGTGGLSFDELVR
jgi:hypothetical protein